MRPFALIFLHLKRRIPFLNNSFDQINWLFSKMLDLPIFLVTFNRRVFHTINDKWHINYNSFISDFICLWNKIIVNNSNIGRDRLKLFIIVEFMHSNTLFSFDIIWYDFFRWLLLLCRINFRFEFSKFTSWYLFLFIILFCQFSWITSDFKGFTL